LGFLHIYSTGDPKKTEHLLALDGAKERLQLLKADLLEEGSFDSAVDGCQGVFTQHPLFFSSPVTHRFILYSYLLPLCNVHNVIIFLSIWW
jgi:hypothetical protein